MVPQSAHQLQGGRQAKQTRQKKPHTYISKELFRYRFFSRIQPLNYATEWGIFLFLLAEICSPFHSNSSRSSCSGPHLSLPLAQWLAQSTWGCSVGRWSNWLQSLLAKSNSTLLCSFLYFKISFSFSPTNQLDFFFHGPIWAKLLLHSHSVWIRHVPFQPCLAKYKKQGKEMLFSSATSLKFFTWYECNQ